MKPSFLSRCLLIAALACPLPHAAFAQANDPDRVSLNFANAEITSVIEAIGKISGKNFLIDPRVKGTLNIITNTPVSRELSYQILLSALRLQGFTAVEGGGVTKIVPEADAKTHAVPVGRGTTVRGGDNLVTQVFPMSHESASQMLAVVRPLVSPNNTVTAFPSNNVLVVTDYAENVNRIARIIASVDVPQGDVTVMQLQHAVAVDLANTLNRLMGEGGGVQGAPGGETLQRVTIIPEAHTNSLLVRADNPARIRAVRQLVASLDRPGAAGNIQVVYLRNAEAVKVAETLNRALSGSGGGVTQVNSSSTLSDALGSNTGNTSTDGSSFSGDGRNTSGLGTDTNNDYGSTGGGGMVQADPVNNALIIVAPDAVYRNLRNVIDQLDRRRAQIYIEALIAEITAERAAEFGIQWQSTNIPDGSSGSGVFGGTNFSTGGNNIIGAMQNPAAVGGGLNLLVGSGTVKIPVGGQMVEVMSLGFLARFLESDTRTNILSTPNLVTLDNEPAKIVVGRNLPFVTGQYTNTGGGTTINNPFQTIERKDVGLTLEVRPQVSEGGTIKLDIYQEASSVVGNTAANALGPTTNTRSIKSTVLIDDGGIIALGGLVEDSYSAGAEKVPLLGDIPWLGQFFRYDTRGRRKTNLVVFLRPLIMRDEGSYTDLTHSRYDYVIGQQTAMNDGARLLLREPNVPRLPDLPGTHTLPQAPAPVIEASIRRVRP